jgi:hypothetical protein
MSKKQLVVALSSCESEYMAASTASQELLWIQQLIKELFLDNLNLTAQSKLYIDNNAAIQLTRHNSNHSRAKHIDIRYHFIKDCVQKKLFSVHYVNTTKQLADILTKPLDTNNFTRLRDIILNNEKKTK